MTVWTAAGAAARLAQYDRLKGEAIIAAVDKGSRLALRYSVTRHMVGLGQGENARPPNPPPGPIGIRSGRLRRAVRALKTVREGNAYVGGLAADLSKCAYAGHETGFKTGAHRIEARRAKVLRFKGRGGEDVFRPGVNHPGSNIPARPYMAPGLADAIPETARFIDQNLQKLLERLLP